MNNSNNGLQKCFDAFERLKKGSAIIDKFRNLSPSKITPSIVSQEAGMDAGYLKKSRSSHAFLIAMINAYKLEHEPEQSIRRRQIETVRAAREMAEIDNKSLNKQLDAALGRELLLIRQIYSLEQKIAELEEMMNANVFPFN